MSYYSKSVNSFNSRKQFFIFSCVIKGKSEFTQEEFLQFSITEEIIEMYAAEYFQLEGIKKLKSIDCPLTINEIYAGMKKFDADHIPVWKLLEQRYFAEVFKGQFREDVYIKLRKEEKCYYCDITMDEIGSLVDKRQLFKKNERGWTFEIDRKKPNKEYSTENCVIACYWCNNAKTDEFDDIEFKPIGKLIGETLRARLKK